MAFNANNVYAEKEALSPILRMLVDAAVKTPESAGLALSWENRRLTNHDLRMSMEKSHHYNPLNGYTLYTPRPTSPLSTPFPITCLTASRAYIRNPGKRTARG